MTTTMEANAEALFKNRTLDEIREVEARTRREAREKAEALRCVRARRDRRPGLTDALRTRRKLLGESYKDAIATVEALEIIEETSRSVAQTSREIERALREMNESVDRSSEREIGEEDARRAAAVERGSRVKFLLDTPEKMWGLLEDCAYEEAAIRLMASVEMLDEMTRGKGRAEALYTTFPVARQQATALNSFKARVSKRARAGLERSGLRVSEVVSALKALVMMENLSATQALTLLLQTRQAWVRACLRDIAGSTVTQESLNKRLMALMADIKHVLKLCFEIFAGEKALIASDTAKSLTVDDLFQGVFEPHVEWEQFQASTKQRREKLETLSSSVVSDACLAWLDRLGRDISLRGVAVFGKMSSCAELAALEATCASDEKEWEESCATLFNRKINLWPTLFEQPWLQQAFALFKKSLSFAVIKPQVDAALVDALKKNSTDSRKESSMWSSSSASKDEIVSVPDDIKCARAVARSMNKIMLTVRKDALKLHGIHIGGNADVEGRLAKLAEHIHACAHKGLVDLAQYLLSKISTQPTEVNGALMIGHLAAAVMDVVKETTVLLKPANVWPKYDESAELIIKPARTLRGLKKPKESESAKIEGVKTEFENAMNAGYEVWVNNCAADTVRTFRAALSSDDSLASDTTPSCWEEVTDKNSEGLQLRLPATPSSYVLTSLHGALQEAQRVGGHLLPRSAIRMLATSLADGLLQAYIDALARPLRSEKGTLQLLLDVKFAMDVLAMKDTSRVNDVQNRLTSALDPIDWATYEPYILDNERRAYRRCAVLLGGFVQLSNLYQDTSIKPASGASAASAKPVARFTYLPVSLPTLRALNSDRGKGKIDWGEIKVDTFEDEEQEGIFSSIMQQSRKGLGNLLRELA